MRPPVESRRTARVRFTPEQHFDALDGDADWLENMIADIRDDVHTVRNLFTGLLVSLTLIALGLAANLFVKGGF